MWFLQQETGNVVDASGGAISQTIINNAFELARSN